MRRVRAFGWLPALALCASLWAAAPAVDTRVDAAYRELGYGDQPAALAHSAELLQQVAVKDRARGAVLALRLDVLSQAVQLNKPAGSELSGAVDALAEGAQKNALKTRFAIAQTYDRGDGEGAFKLAQDALAHAPSGEAPELELWFARTGAYSGHLAEARVQAAAALAHWHAASGMAARWRDVELHYIVGQIDTYTGSNENAQRILREGSALAVQTFGAACIERFKIDSILAGVLTDLGKNRESLEVRETLWHLAEQRYGPASFEAAKAESRVGASYQEFGDYASSRTRYEHAQKLIAALPQAPAQERGVIAVNYGNLLQEMGELDDSLTQYLSALELLGDKSETRHARAVVYADMGNTKLRMQHYEDAVADYRRAIELREAADGKDNPGLAYALEGMGSASLALKHGAEAEAVFRRALTLRERSVSPNHPTVAPLTFGLALARWLQGDLDEAFRLAQQTAEHQQAMLTTFASDFSERQSVAYRKLLTPATALTVTLAAQRGDDASIATAWRLSMIERGLVARTEAHRLAAARAAHDPAVAAAFAAWRTANSALGDAWLEKQQDPDTLGKLTAAAENAERALWQAAGQRDLSNAVSEPAALAQALPADGLLLAYSDGVDPDLDHLPVTLNALEATEWFAFTLAPGAKPRLTRVGGIAESSAAVRNWYVGLRNPKSDPAQLRADGLALRRAVLDPPLAGRQPKHLFIVPEGELYRVSFAALPGTKGGYLVESGLAVHTLANESDLNIAPLALDAPKMLLAGAPDFAAHDVAASASGESAARQLCLRATREGFAAIPNAGRELDDLDTLLSADAGADHVQIVRGAQATKQAVLAALPQANVIHLATHGFSLDESCAQENSRGVTLQRANDDAVQGAGLSGLAFSGASVSEHAQPVGVVSSGELATLDLSHVSWIALSACDSGLGPIGRNEGVFGMRRALRLAGARTVVMSLWQVDDAATADLMGALYRARFNAHADVPVSMADAMRHVIAARRAAGASDHPFYWAAFIGEGGWR